MSSDPADGAGLDCDPHADDCGVPTDTSITLRFDRFLLPSSAVRQSVSVYTGLPSNPALPNAELSPRYDVSERAVRYVFPPGVTLHPKTLYTVDLPIYTEDVPFGFRAFDGAALDGIAQVTQVRVGEKVVIQRVLRFEFFTGTGPGANAPTPPDPSSCEQVREVFDGCAGCHVPLDEDNAPPMGLSLASFDALRATAIGKPAHQTEIGDTTGVTNEEAPRFGVNMPIIDPERPENSYLMYKLLLRPEAYVPGSADDCAGPSACAPPDPDEVERLREWFVRGEPMPEAPPGASFVDHGALRAIQTFIATGADCP